jgi:hypothetical protein
MSKVIWQSTVTEEMVKGWTGEEIEMLIADLDDAVMATCEDMGIGQEDEEKEDEE